MEFIFNAEIKCLNRKEVVKLIVLQLHILIFNKTLEEEKKRPLLWKEYL